MINAQPTSIASWCDQIDPQKPVLIAGPTASGKSALALKVALAQGRQIVNADALQIYACWREISARPSAAEEALVPHRLYGHVGLDTDYSVGHWLREVAQVLSEDPRPVIVGGTGLYFTALTSGLAEIPPTPEDLRQKANARLEAEGLQALIDELDPATRAKVDLLNPVRVQRAWEVLHATGKGLAAWQAETGPPLLALDQAEALVLRPDPEWLGARIDQRFAQMIKNGALDEAKAALPHWDPRRPWAKAIGAPELIAHLQGEISLKAAISMACTSTRQYAKRQRTWMRNRLGHWPYAVLPA